MKALAIARQAPLTAHPAPLAWQELPDPRPGPGHLLVRVRACGICHTDLHIAEGDLPAPRLPLVPGHQVVGTVDELGPGVTTWHPGERVGVAWLHQACGTCRYCREGRENLCPQATFTGFHVPGGYADYLVVPAEFAYRIPDRYTDLGAAPLLCAGIIGYRSLRQAEARPGDRVGLFGFGASAHLALQVARSWGCPVLVFTRSPAHRALALSLGATWAGGLGDPAPFELDCGVVFAPAASVVEGALTYLRPGGTLAVNAIHLDRDLAIPYGRLYRERTLRSVTNATRADGREFLALAEGAALHVEVEAVRPDQANEALGRLKRGDIRGAAVLVWS